MGGKLLVFSVACFLFSVVCADVNGPLTADFQTWLNNNNYKPFNYARTDLGTKGSFGGRKSADERIRNQPIVFIHGNADTALTTGANSTGWEASIAYFLDNSYSPAELYATTWGEGTAFPASENAHDCDTVIRIRKFLEAVIAYTNAPKIDVITHSMGVTIARKAIKGGQLTTPTKTCNLGASLTNKVDTFVGISGANYGLCKCQGVNEDLKETCNGINGFWPGNSCGFNVLDCGTVTASCEVPAYSSFLTDLNSDPNKEGVYIYSMYSTVDEVIMYGGNVWGRPTPVIPGGAGNKIYSTYSHYETKSLTAGDQYNMVVNHVMF
uniref:Lipase n=1 Tax=Panagrellus redivivus TaxID=6233 RepID=A0A7E4VI89_PANRE